MLGDPELIAFIQRLLGYACMGTSKEHIFAILHGKEGRNGKGTLMRTIERVLGGFAQTLSPELLLLQRNPPSSGTPRPDLVHLQGTRLAIFSEINKDRKLDPSVLKNLSGGDTIAARRLFSNETINFQPSHTIFIQTNYKPKAPSEDNALWRRAILIPFDAEFVEEPDPLNHQQKKIDRDLENKLIGESSGILNWIIEGCQEYLKIGLMPPKRVREAVDDYRSEDDGIGLFLKERCEEIAELSTKSSVMTAGIQSFCKEDGYTVPSRVEINQYLSKKYKKYHDNKGDWWRGIRIKDE